MRLLAACALLVAVAAGSAAASESDEATLDLDQFKGKVVLLDFWASWCAPCKASFPWMQHLSRRYPRSDLVVIAVNLDHERSLADRFLEAERPDFTVVFDPLGRIAERYDVRGMPASYYIDRSGHVRFSHAGFRDGDRDAAERQIATLIAEH
jgi:thiol-disulfide isomerase/thioredoxin